VAVERITLLPFSTIISVENGGDEEIG